MLVYKNLILAKNSEAYRLYQEGKFEALDKHIKTVLNNEAELLKRYK